LSDIDLEKAGFRDITMGFLRSSLQDKLSQFNQFIDPKHKEDIATAIKLSKVPFSQWKQLERIKDFICWKVSNKTLKTSDRVLGNRGEFRSTNVIDYFKENKNKTLEETALFQSMETGYVFILYGFLMDSPHLGKFVDYSEILTNLLTNYVEENKKILLKKVEKYTEILAIEFVEEAIERSKKPYYKKSQRSLKEFQEYITEDKKDYAISYIKNHERALKAYLLGNEKDYHIYMKCAEHDIRILLQQSSIDSVGRRKAATAFSSLNESLDVTNGKLIKILEAGVSHLTNKSSESSGGIKHQMTMDIIDDIKTLSNTEIADKNVVEKAFNVLRQHRSNEESGKNNIASKRTKSMDAALKYMCKHNIKEPNNKFRQCTPYKKGSEIKTLFHNLWESFSKIFDKSKSKSNTNQPLLTSDDATSIDYTVYLNESKDQSIGLEASHSMIT
jgi:hypothetical protein